MRQQKLKAAACGMAAVITFSGLNMTAYAAGGLSDVLPSAGVTLTLADNTTTVQTKMRKQKHRQIQSRLKKHRI